MPRAGLAGGGAQDKDDTRIPQEDGYIIKTPMHRPEAQDFLATLHPMRRMGAVEEIVEAIPYLDTAQFATGSREGPHCPEH